MYEINKLEKAVVIVLKKCLAIKRNEKLLIVVDKNKKRLGNLFLKKTKEITDKVKLLEIPVGKVNGEEPPKKVAKEMLKYDVGVLITTKSLTHTRATKNACKKGARIATLPDITEETMKRTMNIDYDKLKERTVKLIKILNKGKIVRATTRLGTDITFNIKGRKGHGSSAGIYNKKGEYGNLPSGEAFLAPVEGKVNGIYIVDASLAGIGEVDKPAKITVKDGYAIKIECGKSAKKLEKIINLVGKDARAIAEFGIGTNNKAIITGNLLEDEKVMGTCHIALGNNTGFGGKIDVPLHIDGVIKKPTVFIDSKKIMSNGKLLI